MHSSARSMSTSADCATSSERPSIAPATSRPSVVPGIGRWTKKPPPCPLPERNDRRVVASARYRRPGGTAIVSGHGGCRGRHRHPGPLCGPSHLHSAHVLGRPVCPPPPHEV